MTKTFKRCIVGAIALLFSVFILTQQFSVHRKILFVLYCCVSAAVLIVAFGIGDKKKFWLYIQRNYYLIPLFVFQILIESMKDKYAEWIVCVVPTVVCLFMVLGGLFLIKYNIRKQEKLESKK